MNTKSLLILFTIPLLYAFSILEEIVVEHDISAITVYLNSAELNRTAVAQIPVGKTDILFRGISNRIKPQGIKVDFSNGVKTYAIRVEEDKEKFKKNKGWLALETQVKELKKKKSTINITTSTLMAELDYLEANYNISNNQTTSTAKLDEWAAHFRDRIKALHDKIANEKDSLAVIKEEMKELLIKQSEQRETVMKTSMTIRVTVLSEAAVEASIDLRYLVSHAVWSPTYALRAEGKNDPITLEYQAQIFNDTGNDWNNKPITLAIIDPSQDISKPTLDAWVLESNSKKRKSAEGRLSKRKSKLKNLSNEETGETRTLEVDDLSSRFDLEDLHMIPADARPHLIDIRKFSKEAERYVLSIPKAKDGAFLVTKIFGWESLGLLNGPMNLYYKGKFQGLTQLDTDVANDTLEVSLGRDNSFSISKQKISSKSSEKLIGFNIKETLTYEFVIKNNKNEAASLEVRDQLPLSVDKSVEVKTLELSNASLDPLNGLLKWNLELKPNEIRRFRLSFSVKYPKSKRGILTHDKWKIVMPRYF